jgi:S1-C subfamily serine protease
MKMIPARSRKGIVVSAVAVIATVIVVSALVGLLVALNSNALSGAAATTTTKTEIAVSVTTANSGSVSNNSSSSINPESIYAESSASIVIIQGTQSGNSFFGNYSEDVLGSGFVVSYSNNNYIVTNYHVAGATSNITVTFSDGNSYAAKVVGSDPYSDLTLLSVLNAPQSEFHPISFATSSNVQIGQYVVAIGNPYGLSDSITLGIVSQLGETIQDPTAGNYTVADAIQFSAPINPGNSGGVLLNANGSVIGMPTAEVSGSQGVGFAIPSDTIIKELPSLVTTGRYDLHPYLGIEGVDMNYELAHVEGTNITYGVLVETVATGGPAASAGLRGGSSTSTVNGVTYLAGGDIITSINGTKIMNYNALATYLEQNTIAGQTIDLGIIRGGVAMTLMVTLGMRPAS